MISQRIFVGICYHKPAPIVSTRYLVPIHVGKNQSTIEMGEMLGDDTGKNISLKNKNWCELTALYWMKHNVKAEYYGLMHYRRVLNFNSKNTRGSTFFEIDAYEKKRFGWTDKDVELAVKGQDIITSPSGNTHPPEAMHVSQTVEDSYSHTHHHDDLLLVESLVRERYPEIYPYFIQVITSRQLFYGNIVIMRATFFEAYTDFIFDILERAEVLKDISDYDSYQSRIWGFLAERLTNVFVAYAKGELNAKTVSLEIAKGVIPPYFNWEKSDRPSRLQILGNKEEMSSDLSLRSTPIDIVLCIDEGFVPHAAVTILSTLDATTKPERVRFTIFSGEEISSENRRKLLQLVTKFGAAIIFQNVDERRLRWLPANRQHISIATYYRLIIADLLPDNVERVIYLDADTVVIEDIQNLWEENLAGLPIGACGDEGGLTQSRRLRLPLTHKYFNAGVLIFDVEALRASNLVSRTQDIYRRYGQLITLQDQDILNILFCDTTCRLPLRWNVSQRLLLGNDLEPSYTHEEALDAAISPAIIHFSDRVKPWSMKSYNPYATIYWKFRNATPWAESRLQVIWRRVVFILLRSLVAKNRKFFSRKHLL